MTPRIIRRLATGGLVLAGLVATLTAQASAPWVDQWAAAQTHRPAQVLNHARIALVEEPGVRLVIHGRVLAPDGKTPVNAVVFAYHTGQVVRIDARTQHVNYVIRLQPKSIF